MPLIQPEIDVSIKFQYKAGIQPTFSPPRVYPISASYGTAVAPGHIVFLDSGNIELVTPGDIVMGVVQNIMTPDGVPFKQGYRPASVAGICTVIPVSMIDLLICEDGVGGVIDFPTDSFVDIVAQTILNTATQNYDPGPLASVLLDSSTAASSIGSLTFQITALAGEPNNIRPVGDTSSPRRFVVVPGSGMTQAF